MKSTYSDVIGRMKEVAKLKNDSAVARALDVTPQALSNYKKRQRMPAHLVIKFACLYGLSVDWILTGEGDVCREAMGEGTTFAIAREDNVKYGRELGKSADFMKLTPDELIYLGKLLKVLRSANLSTIIAVKYSIDAFLKAAQGVGEEGAREGCGAGTEEAGD